MVHRPAGGGRFAGTVSAPPRIHVLLVDDHAVVRRGLRGFLELLDDIEIVGEAENGRLAIDAARSLRPDVVLMDLLMPVLDGVAATAALKDELPDLQVVALTSFIDEDRVTAVIEAGATGFLLKDAEADEVAATIRSAHRGEVRLDPAVARILARRVARSRAPASPEASLTDREREVLSLIAHGLGNQAIADRLGITERTARTHVSNILGKLALSSRTQAALWAVEHHIAGPG
jgi:DNA-binding NarL/FixJ family response regulator